MKSRFSRNLTRSLSLLTILGLVLTPPMAMAQQAAGLAPAQPVATAGAGLDAAASRGGAYVGGMPPAGVVRVDLTGAASQSLALPRGKSAIVELPVDARDVLVTNPAVADAVLRSPRRIYVLGMAAGQTDAVFFDAAGRRILSLDIRVDQDTGALQETINRILPGSRVRVESMNDSVILTGLVLNAGDADKAVQIAGRFVTKPENVLNMMSIAGKDQVMVKVRIIEVQRNIVKQLGFNLSAVMNQIGQPQFLLGTAATFGINGALLGGINSGYKLDTTHQPELQIPCAAGVTGTCMGVFHGPGDGAANWNTATTQATSGSEGLNQAQATVQAFERVGLVRTLAEPNLTAVSGESAKFLAGGEYPVPTGQDSTGKVTIEFKPYGVGLGFTPVVLSGGRISLKLSTEVSELSNQGAFSLSTGTTTGATTLTVPALTVRRAETTVELPSGGSMMIAGLIQDQTKQNLDSLPGLMNLPVLGTLFRSRDYLSGQTELVILVTPYIVDSTAPRNLQTPSDGLQVASDLETNLLGHLNKTVKAPPGANANRTYQGPYGYVIE
jgi:pilus assembly protein CpaC